MNSTSVYPAPLCKIMGIPLISIHNTDIDPFIKISNLFKPIFLTPVSFNKSLGRNHIKIKTYNELAFTHPNNMIHNKNVHEILKISKNEKFILLRFVSWNASDEISKKGLLTKKKNILYKFYQNMEKYSFHLN